MSKMGVSRGAALVGMTDIGVNLHAHQFQRQRETIVKNAGKAGVSHIISISNSRREFEPNLRYCRELGGEGVALSCTIGVHPHNAKELDEAGLAELEQTIVDHRDCVVAVGECGLDYNRMFSPRLVQTRWFEAQVQLARRVKLPLYLHERDSYEDFQAIMKRYPGTPGVVHCFTGSRRALETYLAMGLYIGITGWVCDERRGGPLQELVPLIPLDRILLETDAPWLTPRSLQPRPRFNEPKYLAAVVLKVAQLMAIEPQMLIQAANSNRKALFGV